MFDLTRLNRYKASEANLTYVDGSVVNSYAPVTALDNSSVTIDTTKIIAGDCLQFTVGAEIFIHVRLIWVIGSSQELPLSATVL